MSFIRFLIASALALVVTVSLLLLMHILIQSDMKGPGEVTEYKIPDIVMPEREIVTDYDLQKPEKPDEPEDAPPDLPEPDFDAPDPTDGDLNIAQPTMDRPTIEGPGGFGDGEMIPLTVVQPEYPRRAAQRGTQGYCTVEFTVSASGTTRDPFVVDCPDSVFERPSLRAAERIKYKPRVVDGQAVDVPGVQYKFLFQMAEE